MECTGHHETVWVHCSISNKLIRLHGVLVVQHVQYKLSIITDTHDNVGICLYYVLLLYVITVLFSF